MTARITAAATCTRCKVGRTIHPSGLCGRCRRVPLGQNPAQTPSPALVAPRSAPESWPLGDADRGSGGPLADVHAAPPPQESQLTLASLGTPVIGFVVYGEPAAQGSKDYMGHSKGGDGRKPHAILKESSSGKVKPWRCDVRDAFLAVAGAAWTPLDGDIVLDLMFTRHKPKSEPKTIRTYPRTRPDVDKLIRSTLDGLTGKLWRDDSQVVRFRKGPDKLYVGDPDPDALDQPGAVIRAWVLPREPLAYGTAQ